MNKNLLIVSAAVAVLGLSTLLFTHSANATVAGTAGVGDECNVHAEDSSHICSAGLVCVPKNENSEGNGKCQSTVTPTPTSVQPTATPTPICNSDYKCEPTATPTPTVVQPTDTPTPNNGGGSDGLGCASHDCNTHPGEGAPAQQGVLGASTMATTGSFEDTAMNLVGSAGIILMGLSTVYAKAKKKFSL